MSDDLLRDDATIREAFRAGKRRALAEVYRVYAPLVQTVVSRGFGGFGGFYNPSDRDDAFQTIFAAAFEEKARLRYNGLDPYSKYLRGIAHNVVRRMLERRKRFNRTDGQPEPSEKSRQTAEDQVIDQQVQHVVRAFVDTVTESHEREILNRYFVEGQAEESIAEDLAMTRYRVRKNIQLLHERMQRYLKQHGLP